MHTDMASSSSPPHNETYNADSELESLYSFESTDTEGDLGGPLVQCLQDNSAAHAMHWKRQFKPQDLVNLSRSALSFLPPKTVIMFIAALEELFQLWMNNIDSLANSTGVDSAAWPSSFTGTQTGGNSRSRTSGKRRGASLESDNERSAEDKDRPPSKKKRVSFGESVGKGRKWACPLYQRDHRRYCKKNCAYYPGFDDVSRIK
jgi:hypothetical protein